MCCKAFFRRNALLGLQSLQCRYLTENCVMNVKTRRDCSYCRLQKCFQVGMKKELILSEELKRSKREKILANRQMTLNIIRPVDSLNIKMNIQWNDTDLSYLTNIYNAYESYCRSSLITFEKHENEILLQQPIKSRIKIQHYFHYLKEYETSLIRFFERLPEFKQFTNDQQLALCKPNMRLLTRISIIETINDQAPFWSAIDVLLQSIFGNKLIIETNTLLHEFKVRINDSTCIRLLLIILLFSTFDTYTGETDTLTIYKIQAKYIELLWLYLTQRYGESVACEKISLITCYCLHLQRIGHTADLKRQGIRWQNFFLSSE